MIGVSSSRRDEHETDESSPRLPSSGGRSAVIEKRINDIMATGLKVFPRFSGVRSR
jgi:hypothetical protein